ncbi:MAG: hypothetical protein ACJ8BF_13640 [Gemmatimonadales bacterium]
MRALISIVISLALLSGIGCRPRPTCIPLNTPGTGPNPQIVSGVKFTVHQYGGAVPPNSVIKTQNSPAGAQTGLDAGFSLDIGLSVLARKISATLVQYARPATMEAFDSAGASVGKVTMTAGNGVPEVLTLGGQWIQKVVITSPSDEVLLLRFCYAP